MKICISQIGLTWTWCGEYHVFMSSRVKDKKIVTVSLRTVAIPHIYVKVWTLKSEFPQGDFLRYLTAPGITRQIPF